MPDLPENNSFPEERLETALVIEEGAGPERTAETAQNPYLIPGAIVCAGIIIAAAILGTGYYYTKALVGNTNPQGDINAIRPIGVRDHIVGNPNAAIVIVEYSDFECPYCKDFHATMRKLAQDYASTGKFAWVYRHFPLKEKHPNAETEAIASECVAALGGNTAFWKFTDNLFEITPSNNQLDIAILPTLAKAAGVSESEFTKCLAEKRYADRVEEDYRNAVETGGNGTPWSIVLLSNGEKGIINGAQPYESIKAGIDKALAGLE